MSNLLDSELDRVGFFSTGVRAIPHLKVFLGAREIVANPTRKDVSTLDAIVGWGHKPTANRARAFAHAHDIPYLGLEDGFLRSVSLGRSAPPLSLVVDDVGIYYNARAPSRLELLLAQPSPHLRDRKLLERAAACRQRIVDAKLSKYNHAPVELPPELAALDGEVVLVVDQTEGDASVTLGSEGAAAFHKALQAAFDENPRARVVIKTHPDVVARKKRGYLTDPTHNDRVLVVGTTVNPLLLLERVQHVYTVTSQLGFEALLLNKPVSCFGVPFYAGWGLTRDRATKDPALTRRGQNRSLDELLVAALLLYPRYVNPLTGRRCEAEATIEHLALQRQTFGENNRDYFCFGFTGWKRSFVRRYLHCPGRKPRFVRSLAHARRQGLDSDSTIVVWGGRDPRGLAEEAQRLGAPVYRMEDGFLRSVRLGSDLTAPGSLVLDRRGIYYDPSRPSDLEHLLLHAEFTDEELQRAQRLRQQIVAAKISKYNPTAGQQLAIGARWGQRVVLVPGQVENDASVLRGSPEVRTNAELLERVRQHCPDAYLLYKPHPDVVSGNRRGVLLEAAHDISDQVVTSVSITQCIEVADEVHTMTSLVGYEALLRGKRVVTYGLPFYAGWGLTEDRIGVSHRTRSRTLDELMAAAYLRYPRYYSFRAHAFCTAEEMVTELEQLRAQTSHRPFWRPPWILRQAYNLVQLLGGER